MTAKILIVEDEILVAMQLEDVLTDAGHAVVGVVPDHRSLARLAEVPQIALVDINLRDGRSGPMIARELSANFGTRIVYVTANPDQIDVPAPTAMGVVSKPFSPQAVLGAIAYALAGGEGIERPRELKPVCR